MNDEKAWNEEQAARYYQQVKLYAEKYGKNPKMAYMATKEKYPSVYITPELQHSPLPDGLELDPDVESALQEKAKAFAMKQGGARAK